jgi:hypothetical protein
MKHLKMLFLWGTLFFVMCTLGCASTTSARVPSDYSPAQREVIDLAHLFVEKLKENSYTEAMAIIKTNELEYWFALDDDTIKAKKGGYQDFAGRLENFYKNALLKKAELGQVSLPQEKFSDTSATIYASFSYTYEIIKGEKKDSIETKRELVQMEFTKDQKEWKLTWLTGQYGHGLLFPIK